MRRFVITGALAAAVAACSAPDRFEFDQPAARTSIKPARASDVPPLGTGPAATIGASFGADAPFLTAGEAEGALAEVEGTAIEAHEVLDALLFYQREPTQEMVRKIVELRLVTLDAERLNVRVPEAVLAAEEAKFLERARSEVKRIGDGTLSFESYLRDELASDPDAYLRTMRRYIALGLLRDRVIRADLKRRDQLYVRGLSLRDRAMAERAAADLRAGASFEILAQQLDPTAPASTHGVWPALPLDDPHPVVQTLAQSDAQGFQAPIEQRIGTTSVWHVVEIVDRQAADLRAFDEVAESIELGLREQAIQREEYLVWLRGALRRWRVDGPQPR